MADLSPDQIAENWGAIAADYERAFEGLSTQYAAHALRLLELRPGERVLDVAAGTGTFSLQAARAGAEVLATDFAPGMVDRLKARMEAAGFQSVTVVTSTATQQILEPEAYWADFTRSAPPLAFLFGKLGPERTAVVGQAYLEALRAQAEDGVPTLSVEA